jgi:hypothetical protein
MTSSCFSCHHEAHTRARWPPGPSSQAYLSLHSSEAPQSIDLSRLLFTCTNANQPATCTCNTQPRVSPHHIINHSSQLGATIHRSSDAPVLSTKPRLLPRWSPASLLCAGVGAPPSPPPDQAHLYVVLLLPCVSSTSLPPLVLPSA